MDYLEFLQSKMPRPMPVGFEVAESDIMPQMFPFQRDIVRWAVRRGRAAVFANCGLGKTPIQLEWARLVSEHTNKPVLVFAPLAVAQQTKREGEKFGVDVTVCREQSHVAPGVNVANYEMLHRFDASKFSGIVLDESSILKNFDGTYRKMLTEFASGLDYRLACTATPAPNDLIEITNHAEFLGVLSGKEIIALYFRQDGNTTHKWRLKGHAETAFWEWMASWAIAVRSPSDLGYPDGQFVLPPLKMIQHTVDGHISDGVLFPVEAHTMMERRQARKESIDARVQMCADLANNSTDPWLMWCGLNAESAALKKAIPDAVEVKGSDSIEHKTDALLGFSSGKYRVLITKPSIAGHGMNWQHCSHMAFVGLSDSFEELYQAIRRCWRFGQSHDVTVHMVVAETEGAVVRNIEEKEQNYESMMDDLVKHMGRHSGMNQTKEIEVTGNTASGENWRIDMGDSCETIKTIPDNSVGLSVFSPPFPGMYAYTNSARDIGNCRNIGEMMDHFRFMIPDLLRITMPGRSCCVHLCQSVTFKGREGHTGLKDFRGEVIRSFEDGGWIYYGEVCIEKNPQVTAVRTKDAGLLFKSLASDSSRMHMALADYVIQFRKPGDNPAPIRAGISQKYENADGWITPDEWIRWASPVWPMKSERNPDGIRQTDVLESYREGRSEQDEKHICPLQLDVIERCVKLWSAPGDLVYSPFTGIGSEGYVSVKLGRKFRGCELKESYWKVACGNLERAEREHKNCNMDLFAYSETNDEDHEDESE